MRFQRGLHAAISEVAATRFSAADPEHAFRDELAVEEPLEIRVDGETLAVTMRTPGHDEELALGLLLAEGIVSSLEQVGSVARCGQLNAPGYGNAIEVRSAPGRPLDLEARDSARRGTLTTSACGVCGRQSIDDLVARCRPLASRPPIERRAIAGLADRLRLAQPGFERTGAMHAAAIVSLSGEYLLVREDIGRHNAVDKIVGRALLDRALPASDRMLVVSGRVSFEIVQKAVVAGLGAVVGVSAPTTLAVQTAERTGLLLVGFCRGERFSVYAGAERLTGV
jgi:FdhD protein